MNDETYPTAAHDAGLHDPDSGWHEVMREAPQRRRSAPKWWRNPRPHPGPSRANR